MDEIEEIDYPSSYFTCGDINNLVKINYTPTTIPSFGYDDYEQIYQSIVRKYDDELEDHEKAEFVACLVRNAGHDFMDFRYRWDGKTSGGSDGCMNYEDDINKGLI